MIPSNPTLSFGTPPEQLHRHYQRLAKIRRRHAVWLRQQRMEVEDE